MKKLVSIMLVIITGMPLVSSAQRVNRWNLGISAEFGQDDYDRKYPAAYDKYPDLERRFRSNYPWGVGIWMERYLNRSFSGLARVNYMQKDMHPNTYGEPSRTTGQWFIKEKHHYMTADVGGRWYVNPNSKIRIYIDVKMGVSGFVAIDTYEERAGKSTITGLYGFDRWQPLGLAALGVNWKRLALSLEYNRDLKRAEKHGYDTSILRQGLAVKTSFAIIKPH
jgi:hypothetical protein